MYIYDHTDEKAVAKPGQVAEEGDQAGGEGHGCGGATGNNRTERRQGRATQHH